MPVSSGSTGLGGSADRSMAELFFDCIDGSVDFGCSSRFEVERLLDIVRGGEVADRKAELGAATAVDEGPVLLE